MVKNSVKNRLDKYLARKKYASKHVKQAARESWLKGYQSGLLHGSQKRLAKR